MSLFLGYVESTASITGVKTKNPLPFPTFRVLTADANEEVPFDSTLLLIIDGEQAWTDTEIKRVPVLGDIPALGRLFRSEKKIPGKFRQTFILITPHVVDSAGNRIDLKK